MFIDVYFIKSPPERSRVLNIVAFDVIFLPKPLKNKSFACKITIIVKFTLKGNITLKTHFLFLILN